MEFHTGFKPTFRYLIITIGTFLVLQGMVVVLHEFTHSTMGWFLGETATPLTVIWGNPLTMTGWDEGVPYQHIFAQGHGLHGAIIGFCPLVMHSMAAAIAILLMRGKWLPRRKWVFNAVYWYAVINFMELIAYVYMRSFSGHGDIGNFDTGLGISPWWVFVFGSAALTWGLRVFYGHALPRLQSLFAQDNPATRWAILILTSFALFLWGSGIRVMAYVDDIQWLFGLIGVVGFGLTVWLCRPVR